MSGERVEVDGVRYYRCGGLLLPSVTTVLDILPKPWLQEWKERIGEEEANDHMQESALIGTLMHDAFERVSHYEASASIIEDISPETEGERRMISSYERWFQRNVQEVIATEHMCWTLRGGGFAGTADALFKLYSYEYPVVVDFKTTNSPHILDWQLQIAAYRAAFFDMKTPTSGGIVLHIDKSYGRIITIPIMNYQKSIEAFIAARTLWGYINE